MKHSVTSIKHLTKSLLSVTLDKKVSVKCTSITVFLSNFFVGQSVKKITVTAETLLSAAVTFDKVSIFVECLLYQYSVKKSLVDLFTSSFAGCLGGTRQSLCRRHMVSWPVTFL
jgi:alpha-D-ribose 1-methylphosphonate 5-triphosphate synthase subunit PhnL